MIEQRSELWLMQRKGCLTASRMNDAIAKTSKGSYTAKRYDVMYALMEERLTDQVTSIYVNQAMQWGIDTEPQAKAAYTFLTDRVIEEAPFVLHPTLPMTGASPDGYVGADGLIEIKCPTTRTHIENLESRSVPLKYYPQMQWQMECTGRDWCDFVSFDPRMPERLQTLIIRVERDEKYIDMLIDEVIKFETELQHKIKSLNEEL